MLKRCLEELEVDTKRYPPRAIRARISDAKNQLIDAETYQEHGGRPVRGDGRPGLPPLRAPDARGERDGLRRPADAHGQRARALRGRPAPLPRALPLGPGRRVPGHQPRPVPAAAAARRGGREPDRRRRRRPVDLRLPRRRGPQHPRVRRRLPRRRTSSSSSRTTAPPRPSSRPPTRSSPTTRAGSGSTSGRTWGRARRSTSPSSTTSTPRPASSPARSRSWSTSTG